jgi:hypothetical protein
VEFSIAGVKAAYTRANPPKEVHQGFLAFVGALAVGLLGSLVALIFAAFIVSAVSSSLGATSGLGIGLGVVALLFSAVIYAVALFILIQMRAGRTWARMVITVLGGIGLLFGVLGLFSTLATFGLVGFDLFTVVSSLLSLAQLGLIAAGIYLVWRPSTAGYFS